MSNVIDIETIRATAARQRHTKRVVPIHRVARAPRAPLPCLGCQIQAGMVEDTSFTVTPCSCGPAA